MFILPKLFSKMCFLFHAWALDNIVKLTQYCGAVETFNTRKSIFQGSRKTFLFLNHVNINSFQSYSLSTFILFVFLFLELKHNGHKVSMKFCLVSFSNGFFAKLFSLIRVLNVLLRQAYQYATGT